MGGRVESCCPDSRDIRFMSEHETKRTLLRVRVDPIKCTAFGFCAEFLPEVFELDDWGYAWIQRPEIPASLAAEAYETARRCPTGAILVQPVEELELDPREETQVHRTEAAKRARKR